ncbi:MAG: ankyrin repeat domain-containing protein [Acidobacteriota bacterium]
MSRFVRALCGFLMTLVLVPLTAGAQDSAIGTFTVDGQTIRFGHVYATLETDPTSAAQEYLILLASDVAVAPADQAPDRLQALAQAGTLHAVRIRWKQGVDNLSVVPYHAKVAESGRAFPGVATLNLTAYDGKRVHAEFKSKMLGQTWFFNALVKTPVVKGGVAVLEPEATLVTEATPAGGGAGGGVVAAKRSLGGLGYEFTPEAFFQAIGDHNAAAVSLFLQAGMAPNQTNSQNRYALNHAVALCASAPDDIAAVITALVAAKADVKTKDPDNGTTALVGAVQSCTAGAVDTLVKAGSDLTAKSNGGMTAFQLANIFQRADVAAVLAKAGAK